MTTTTTRNDLPTLAELAECVHQYAQELKAYSPAELREYPGDTAGGECRLQVRDGSWQLWTGDSQFDTDSRGEWSSAFVPRGAGMRTCRTIARDMLADLE